MVTSSQISEDPRDVHELVNAVLCECDREVRWPLIAALHQRGSQEVLQAAQRLCVSPCTEERSLGAHLLGQLGCPDRTFPNQCQKILIDLLEHEREPRVLQATFTALYHLAEPYPIRGIERFIYHDDPEVRFSLTMALSSQTDEASIPLLIKLSDDADPGIRDFATFALGTLIDLDTPEIRAALWARLEDPDDDTRAEALIGLAQRHDLRVIPALKRELSSTCVGSLAVEAAELIASGKLVPELIALRSWWDVDSELLERAIQTSMTGKEQEIATS